MRNLENDLRTLLADEAESAPTEVQLLTAVKQRSRHKAIARRAGVVGLVAITVGAIAVAVPAVLSGSAQHSRQLGVSSSASPPSRLSSTAPATLQLEPVANQPTVTFPYHPTFVPAGFPPATVIRTQSDFLLHARQLDNSKLIRVGVDATKPSLADAPNLAGAKLQPVTVRGHTGSIATGGGPNPARLLFWPEKPGLWLDIYSVGVSRSDLLRYAEGLRQGTLKNTEAFRYALLPPSLVIHESLHYNTTFSPADAPPDADPIGGLVVTLDNPTPPTGTRVQVGNHTGYLNTADGGRELLVDLGQHAILSVTFAGLSDADLIRFAAGVTVDLSNI